MHLENNFIHTWNKCKNCSKYTQKYSFSTNKKKFWKSILRDLVHNTHAFITNCITLILLTKYFSLKTYEEVSIILPMSLTQTLRFLGLKKMPTFSHFLPTKKYNIVLHVFVRWWLPKKSLKPITFLYATNHKKPIFGDFLLMEKYKSVFKVNVTKCSTAHFDPWSLAQKLVFFFFQVFEFEVYKKFKKKSQLKAMQPSNLIIRQLSLTSLCKCLPQPATAVARNCRANHTPGDYSFS